MQWMGHAPGMTEAVHYGLYKQRVGDKWQPCRQEAEGAVPDVERVLEKAKWSRRQGRFVIMEIELKGSQPHSESDHVQKVDRSLAQDIDRPAKPLMPETNWKEPLTIAQFAKAVCRSPSTIRSWIKKEKIEARQVTVGSKQQWVVPRSALPTK